MQDYQLGDFPVKAVLWDGRFSSAPTGYNVSVCDRTRDLIVEMPHGDLRVPVGQYFVVWTQAITCTMTAESFHANAPNSINKGEFL